MGRLARLPWRLRYYDAARLASRWRQLSTRMTHLHADVTIARSAWLGPRFELWIPGPARLQIGPGCQLRRDFYAEIDVGGVVEIGPHTAFTGASAIQVSSSLVIGTRCVFGVGTFIADGNHRFKDHTRHLLDQGYDLQPITIGDGAIVTSKCTILASIGKGAVVGANSVVTRPVPDYCLAVGAPARVVEYFGPPDLAPPDIPLPSPRHD